MNKYLGQKMSQLEQWMWNAENRGHTKAMRTLWHSTRIAFAVLRDVFNGHITLHAMGLVYTTLLSLVPFLALSFSVLKGFGVHNQLEPLLDQYLASPLGEQGEEVTRNILTFVDNIKVGVLGSLGLALLLYTVISLVQKVERSFNEIWRVNTVRPIGQRFANYLSVILVGPVLMFAALGATATVIGSDTVKELIAIEPLGWIFSFFSRLMPYLVVIGLFTFLYVFIPNTKVKIKNAFIGGVVAGVFWQTAGVLFAVFVFSSNFTKIYSGFAAGIVLLIWLYVSWLILLIGASVAFYCQHARQITQARIHLPSASVDERTGLAIMYEVAKQYDEAGGGVGIMDMEARLSVGPETIQRIRNKLIKAGLLTTGGSDNDQLLPAQSLDKITLANVIQVLRAPESTLPASLMENSAVVEVAALLETSCLGAVEKKTVADWVRGKS